MCLAVPGRIVGIRESGGIRMASVDFGGVEREACLEYLPEAVPGDYVMVHVGFAISRVDPEEAARTLEYLREMEELSKADLAADQPRASGEPDEVP